MAENEILDFGHRSRWRASRAVLKDSNATLAELVACAGEDFDGVMRRLPVALRKGPGLLILLRAAQESPVALQEVVAAFTEKRLAKLALTAGQLCPSNDPAEVAQTSAQLLIDALVDQIALRAKRERRFCAPDEQDALRASLAREFGKNFVQLSATLEASMRGARIKPIKRAAPRIAVAPKDVARLSLVVRRPEQPHAR
ncbi:hypothetical protein [Tahibacter caeni]|uniref:hypothetical protein n=1 Tax=Tahibacter caeni TaxID=1453545 RepID=UPI002148661F|nr:hypothetical protein [Tahibacter caeni]